MDVIVEVKDEAERRAQADDYRNKLDLAASVYRAIGTRFIVVYKSRDIVSTISSAIRDISLNRLSAVTGRDIGVSIDCVERRGGQATVAELAEVLGGGPIGLAKLCALHVRRVVSIDLRGPFGMNSPVRAMCDGVVLMWRQ